MNYGLKTLSFNIMYIARIFFILIVCFGIMSTILSWYIKYVLKKHGYDINILFIYAPGEIKNFKKIAQTNNKYKPYLVTYYFINILLIIFILLAIYNIIINLN